MLLIHTRARTFGLLVDEEKCQKDTVDRLGRLTRYKVQVKCNLQSQYSRKLRETMEEERDENPPTMKQNVELENDPKPPTKEEP